MQSFTACMPLLMATGDVRPGVVPKKTRKGCRRRRQSQEADKKDAEAKEVN